MSEDKRRTAEPGGTPPTSDKNLGSPAGYPPGVYPPKGFVPPSGQLPRGKAKGAAAATPTPAGNATTTAGGVPGKFVAAGLLVLLVTAGGVAFVLKGAGKADSDEPAASSERPVAALAAKAVNAPAPAPAAASGGVAGELPGWAPRFPGAKITNAVSAPFKGDLQGSFELTSGAGLPQLVDFYVKEFDKADFTVTVLHRMKDSGLVQARSIDGKRQVIAVLQPTSTGSKGTVTFTTQHPDKSVPVSGRALPDFAPMMPDATLLEQATRATGRSSSGYMKFLVSEVMSEVLDFYQPRFEKAGFTVERKEIPQIGRLTGKGAADGRALTLIATPQNGKTEVTLSLGEPG